MKRSDYEAKSRRFWMDSVTPPMEAAWIPGWLEKYVANDVRAAEAAGVAWDPEEEPLPGSLYVADLAKGKARILADGLNQDYARDLTHREAVEIKRRYEAWPELESIVSELPDDDAGSDPCRFSCKLYSIRRVLRGGAS